MGKTLIIVESPTKARTISKFLGNDCTVLASNGHIRTLPKNDLCIDIKNGYRPKYIIDDTKKDIIARIKAELKDADSLILATDEDREGESISWHLLEVLNPKVPYKRMVFHEITKKAILEAFENGRDIDMNLVHAQEARRVLDRLYGYSISPVLWSKLSSKNLSAGRVQSPGLGLVVEREKTRMAFEKSEYWDVKAVFKDGFEARLDTLDGKKLATSKDFDNDSGLFKGSKLLLSENQAKEVSDRFSKCVFTVTDVQEKEQLQKPSAPFTTSTLQQEGNRKLHLSAKDTMKTAQSLYEKGYITYMRTDSTTLSEEGTEAAREAVRELYGNDYVSAKAIRYASKTINIQEAHEAIRPAGDHFAKPEDTGLKGRELDLYTLIWKRTLACQMTNAKKMSTIITAQTSDSNGNAIFSASGTRIVFPGFIRVYVEGSDDPDAALEDKETVLPVLTNGQTLSLSALKEVKHETKAPNRYTEASLVQELEKLGIGRPSTYASIIDKLFEKNYVTNEKGSLVPTFTGFGVIQLLQDYFGSYIDYGFTSSMENNLDSVAEGKANELQFLKEFWEGCDGLEALVKENKTKISKAVKRLSLPQLSDENTIFLGPYGPYVKDADGKFISLPKELSPATITDKVIEDLKKGSTETADKSKGPKVLGSAPDGTPVLYCSGRFGDYWQLGDMASGAEVKRFKIPKDYIGKDAEISRIMEFFCLPKNIGKAEDGSEITADIGRFGPYLKCKGDFRSLKNVDMIFSVTEEQAREIFAQPKAESKSDDGSAKAPAKAKKSPSASTCLVDFGQYEGKNLGLYQGRYGYYLRFGEDNVSIPQNLRHNEQQCKALTLEQVVSFIKTK